MEKSDQKKEKAEKQSNIGYENTKWSNDRDDLPMDRVQSTDTGQDEGPVENKNDSAGLRSESGSKSMAGESGNKEQG